VTSYPTPELFRRFPELRERLPWVSLARATPVERLARLESYLHAAPIWVKRDDLTSDLCGGDKARKLEFLFGDVLRRGSRRILVVGGVGSGCGLAVTAFAHHFHLRAMLATVRSAAGRETLLRALEIEHELGAELHRLDGGFGALWRFLCSLSARPPHGDEPRWPYVVRQRRTETFATLGYANAALELARQIHCGILPEPERIYVPVRTGTTAAGLVLGCALGGIRSRIVGVATGAPPDVGGLARRAARVLERRTSRFPTGKLVLSGFELRSDFAGGRGLEAPLVHQAAGLGRDLEGLGLDRAYGGRALATLVRDQHSRSLRGPALFWHAPAANLLARSPQVSADALPREFREFFVAR
jgi:D-cysteine desulfhydrase